MTTSTLPDGLSLRAPTLDDVPAVLDVYAACSLADGHAIDVTAGEVRQWWETPGFDLGTSAQVVVTPLGRVVGYGEVWCPEPFTSAYGEGRVYPAYLGQGIGTVLLGFQEAQARECMTKAPSDARLVLTHYAEGQNDAAKALLEQQGYQLTRRSWRMAIDLDGEPPMPEWPEGITVRQAVPGQDDHAAYEAVEEAFADTYDHTPVPFERWLHWHTSDPERYDPTLWFLALDGGEIAGVCLCRPRANEDANMGWVSNLAVRRPWRRRGVGMAQLRHSFREFYRRGKQRVGLGVDAESLTGATRLYERAGMRVVREYERYEKTLRPGRDISRERI